MARPREFDRERAVQAAIGVFWGQGYEATSTDDLLRAMGIGRQSLYDTFGNKHQLYLEALEKYNATSLSALVDTFRQNASPLAALEELLLAMATATAETRHLGCLGINAICEFGQSDAAVEAIGATSNSILLSALEQVLRLGQQKGEVNPAIAIRQAARFLSSVLAGMKVRAKAGDVPEELRDVAAFALDSLRVR